MKNANDYARCLEYLLVRQVCAQQAEQGYLIVSISTNRRFTNYYGSNNTVTIKLKYIDRFCFQKSHLINLHSVPLTEYPPLSFMYPSARRWRHHSLLTQMPRLNAIRATKLN